LSYKIGVLNEKRCKKPLCKINLLDANLYFYSGIYEDNYHYIKSPITTETIKNSFIEFIRNNNMLKGALPIIQFYYLTGYSPLGKFKEITDDKFYFTETIYGITPEVNKSVTQQQINDGLLFISQPYFTNTSLGTDLLNKSDIEYFDVPIPTSIPTPIANTDLTSWISDTYSDESSYARYRGGLNNRTKKTKNKKKKIKNKKKKKKKKKKKNKK